MATRKLTVEIIGDPASASKAFKKVGDDAGRFEARIKRAGSGVGHAFLGIGKAATAAGTAIGAGLVYEGARAVKAFEETRKVAAQTNAVLKSTGGVANVSASQVADLATSISRKTGVDDEAIQSGENLLLTFTKLRDETGKGNDIFTQATKIVTDMSVALGQDTKSSAIQVGKALNDPIKGVTALQRVGVSFTQSQKDQIKTLVDTGKSMEAQKLILRELNTEFKGSAEAQATPLDKAKVAAGNLEEALGGGLRPAVDAVATEFTKLATKAEPELNRLTKQLGRTFKRDDIDLADKFRLSWAKIQRKLAPFGQEAEQAFRRAHLGDRLSRLIEQAAPLIADAMARAAPRAAGAFVNAFKDAGPWGKLVTVAFLASKLGAFSAAGTWAAGRFTTSMKRRMGQTMPTVGDAAAGTMTGNFASQASQNIGNVSGKGGRLRTAFTRAGRGLGSAFGIAAALEFGVELAKGVEKTLGDIAPGGLGGKGAGVDPQHHGIPGSGWNLFDYIKSKIGDGVGKITHRVEDAMGGPLPQGGAFGGSLMGARPAMRPFAALGSRFGLQVSSGRRPGAITSSGNQSWHSTGEAIDMSGPSGGMLRFFKTMRARYGGRLAELIYTPGGVGIKNGHPFRYGGQVAADHYDHVHVAFDSGKPGLGDGLGQIRDLWVRAGGPKNKADIAAAVAYAESTGNPTAINRNSDGSVDRGLWQINSIHGRLSTFDRLGNARAAVSISNHGRDWTPWTNYRNGKYKPFLHIGGDRGGGGGDHRTGLTPAQRTARQAFQRHIRGASRAAGRAAFEASLTGPGFVGGYDQQIATAGTEEAAARAKDNLPALIKALKHELRIKRARLKKVKRTLKRRIKADTRRDLTEERGQLIADIAELASTLKEYEADAKGGATTISAAEKLDAGVPEGGPPTAADFADLAIAEAALTPGTEDDLAALNSLLGIRQGELDAARATGDPRKILEALSAWSSVKDAIDQLKAAVDPTSDLVNELKAVKDELKRQNDFASSVAGIASREAVKALADVISGQIYGPLRGRVGTAGNGTIAITP